MDKTEFERRKRKRKMTQIQIDKEGENLLVNNRSAKPASTRSTRGTALVN